MALSICLSVWGVEGRAERRSANWTRRWVISISILAVSDMFADLYVWRQLKNKMLVRRGYFVFPKIDIRCSVSLSAVNEKRSSLLSFNPVYIIMYDRYKFLSQRYIQQDETIFAFNFITKLSRLGCITLYTTNSTFIQFEKHNIQQLSAAHKMKYLCTAFAFTLTLSAISRMCWLSITTAHISSVEYVIDFAFGLSQLL